MSARLPLLACLALGLTRLAGPPASLRLPDEYGRLRSVDAHPGRPLALVFLTTGCPLARAYAPRLAELAAGYGPRGVVFLAVSPGPTDTLSSLATFRHETRLPFPVLADPECVLADRYGVTRTPEVVLLDARRHVSYRGRIDDQFAPGTRLPRPTRRYLADALDALLAGQPAPLPVIAPVGCRVTRPPAAPEGPATVTWANRAGAIVRRRCAGCHRPGEAAPFPLLTWADARGWAGMLREVVASGAMPPWPAAGPHGQFRNDARLTPGEKADLLAWLDAGCPAGGREPGPAAPTVTSGWRIARPELVLPMSASPEAVPAEGEVEYRYFTVDPGFTTDRYVRAAEVRPGNRRVVHHALVLLRRPGPASGFTADADDPLGALLDFAPGMPPLDLPEGYAVHVPAGSRFVFQMHYTPTGTPETDLTRLGLVFAEPESVKHLVRGAAVVATDFEIPPGAGDHRATAELTLTEPVTLTSLSPHLHLRGKSFRWEAHLPGGERRVLVDVPRWDFNWQLRYDLARPLPLPRGTRLVCHAAWDNSEGNPHNPDPTARVGWGDRTADEMLIGFFGFVVPKGPLTPAGPPGAPPGR